MNTISTIRNNVSILTITIFMLPLLISAMSLFIWALQMNLGLFAYDNQLYALFMATGVFSIPYLRIIKGEINSFRKLGATLFVIYMLSMNGSTFSYTNVLNVNWKALILTTFLSALIAYIISTFSNKIKVAIKNEEHQKTDKELEQDKAEDVKQEQTDSLEEILVLKKQTSRYWNELENCRSALLKYIKKDLNSKAQFCSTCDNELSSIKYPTQN